MTWVHALAALALAINAASLTSVLRHVLRLRRPQIVRDASATIILPVTGTVPGLEDLIEALNAQTLRPRRLIAALESDRDPAWRRIEAVAPSAHFPIERVAGGEATHQGQKCRNQQAALARIDAQDEVIVLMDADTRPQSWWLSALVSPIADGTADIVTAHRWQQVEKPRLGAHLVTAIDRGLTLLPRFDSRLANTIWGGSVGISRRAAERMDLDGVLSHTLSDDLSVAAAASDAELRILTRGALLVPSPGGLDLAAAFRFGARQYRICHIYLPWLWRLALAAVAVRCAAWIVLIGQAVLFGAFVPALAGLAVLATLKQGLVGEIGRRIGQPDPPRVRLVQIMFGPLQVLVDLFHLGVVVAAARTTPIVWSHVVYDIAGPHDIRVRGRLPFPPA